MSDLHDLSKPFSSSLVHNNPSGGGSYVKHHVVNQRLLLTVGPFDFELVQIVRGFVAGKAPNPNGSSQRAKAGTPDLVDCIVGAICRLRCEVDGRIVTIEEVGDCEEPHNWTTDGARMKDAMSDAFKRCAMRLGLGLHLWSQDEYFLDRQLAKRESGTAAAGDGPGKGAATVGPIAAQFLPSSPAVQPADGTTSPPSPPDGPVMSNRQSRAIFALLRQLKISDDGRHAVASDILGREVASFTSVTVDEAKRLIEELGRRADAMKAGVA